MMKIIFLGPPGSGKGTYSSRIGRILDIPHISTGDLFREAIKKRTKFGNEVSEYLRKGELVPDETTIKVLTDRLSQPDCSRGFILDGYPRTMPQAEALDVVTNIDVVFNLMIHEVVLIKKLAARRICRVCGEIYNLAAFRQTIDGIRYVMEPILPKISGICDKCGGELEQRKDDTIDVIKARLNIYKLQTEPLIQYYAQRGLLKEIFVNAGPEIIVPNIMTKLKRLKS